MPPLYIFQLTAPIQLRFNNTEAAFGIGISIANAFFQFLSIYSAISLLSVLPLILLPVVCAPSFPAFGFTDKRGVTQAAGGTGIEHFFIIDSNTQRINIRSEFVQLQGYFANGCFFFPVHTLSRPVDSLPSFTQLVSLIIVDGPAGRIGIGAGRRLLLCSPLFAGV